MKASEFLEVLRELVASGHGDKHLYVSDDLIVTDIHVIGGIKADGYGIELFTDYANKEELINEM